MNFAKFLRTPFLTEHRYGGRELSSVNFTLNMKCEKENEISMMKII